MGGALAAAVNTAALAVVAFVACEVTYLGLFPAIRAARGLDVGTGRAAVRFGRRLAVLIGSVAVIGYAIGQLHVSSAGELLGFLIVIRAAFYVAGAWLIRLSRETRAPTDDERKRIEAACERADFDPRSVRVLDTDDSRVPTVTVRRPPEYRTLFVGSYLLSAYGDDELTVQVARAGGQVGRGYLAVKLGARLVVLAAIAAYDSPVAASMNPLVVLGGGALVALAIHWHGNRTVYAADEDAVEATSTETVRAFYETLVRNEEVTTGGNRIVRFLRMRPTIGRRLGRLDRQHEPTD